MSATSDRQSPTSDSDAATPVLSIIIVNYNTTDLLMNCLDSIKACLGGVSYEIVVVDNASDSFSPEAVRERHCDVSVVLSETNIGFGQATNLGAANAAGRYLWLLNPDTVVPPEHGLDSVIRFLDQNPVYAAAAPVLLDESGQYQPGQRAYLPNLVRMLADKPAKLAARVVPRLKRRMASINPDWSPLTETDVDVLSATALVIYRHAFEQVGGFSDEYFMYYEDTDLCCKLGKAGFRLRFCPTAKVVHLSGRSISDACLRRRLYYASQVIYLRKWSSPAAATVARWLQLPILQFHCRDKLLKRARKACK